MYCLKKKNHIGTTIALLCQRWTLGTQCVDIVLPQSMATI